MKEWIEKDGTLQCPDCSCTVTEYHSIMFDCVTIDDPLDYEDTPWDGSCPECGGTFER